MCLTGIHGQIYMAWTGGVGKKKKDTEKVLKNQIVEQTPSSSTSCSLEVAYTVSAQSFILST